MRAIKCKYCKAETTVPGFQIAAAQVSHLKQEHPEIYDRLTLLAFRVEQSAKELAELANGLAASHFPKEDKDRYLPKAKP